MVIKEWVETFAAAKQTEKDEIIEAFNEVQDGLGDDMADKKPIIDMAMTDIADGYEEEFIAILCPKYL